MEIDTHIVIKHICTYFQISDAHLHGALKFWAIIWQNITLLIYVSQPGPLTKKLRKIVGCACAWNAGNVPPPPPLPPRHQRKTLVSDHSMHHGTCVTHVPCYMSGSLTRGGGENVPGIPGAFATHSLTYLTRGLLLKVENHFCLFQDHVSLLDCFYLRGHQPVLVCPRLQNPYASVWHHQSRDLLRQDGRTSAHARSWRDSSLTFQC